jgi:hypothetical protein
MVCQQCYKEITHGNTIFFDETKYPRIRDINGNIILKHSKIEIIIEDTNSKEIELNYENILIESE